MAIYDFYRNTYSQVAITITSNEVLGKLDTDYIEDYYGVDGQITLYHPDTNTRYPVLITAIVAARQFIGYFNLANKPLGRYEIQGKVQDMVGNVTIIGSVNSGQVSSRVELQLFIRDGVGTGSPDGILRLEGIDKNAIVFNGIKRFYPLIFKSGKKW